MALTLPTGGGRSVGIVRSRNKATELVYYKGASTLSSLHAVASQLAVPLGIADNSPVIRKMMHII